MHDVRDYDRFKEAITNAAVARLKDANAEAQRREVDPLVASLAGGLRVIFSANASAFSHIPADEAAAMLLASWPRPRFERI
jgi:hypothetical protein